VARHHHLASSKEKALLRLSEQLSFSANLRWNYNQIVAFLALAAGLVVIALPALFRLIYKLLPKVLTFWRYKPSITMTHETTVLVLALLITLG